MRFKGNNNYAIIRVENENFEQEHVIEEEDNYVIIDKTNIYENETKNRITNIILEFNEDKNKYSLYIIKNNQKILLGNIPASKQKNENNNPGIVLNSDMTISIYSDYKKQSDKILYKFAYNKETNDLYIQKNDYESIENYSYYTWDYKRTNKLIMLLSAINIGNKKVKVKNNFICFSHSQLVQGRYDSNTGSILDVNTLFSYYSNVYYPNKKIPILFGKSPCIPNDLTEITIPEKYNGITIGAINGLSIITNEDRIAPLKLVIPENIKYIFGLNNNNEIFDKIEMYGSKTIYNNYPIFNNLKKLEIYPTSNLDTTIIDFGYLFSNESNTVTEIIVNNPSNKNINIYISRNLCYNTELELKVFPWKYLKFFVKGAFDGFNSISEIEYYPSIIEDRDELFSKVPMKKIILKENYDILDLPKRCFYKCLKLTNIEGFENIKQIGYLAEINNYTEFFYNDTMLDIDFSNWNIEKIYGDRNFSNTGIININSPTLKLLDYATFSNCEKLKSINCPSLETIEHSVFYNCINLIDVNCPKLTFISNNKLQWESISIVRSDSGSPFINLNIYTHEKYGKSTFNSCFNLKHVHLQENTNYLPSYFFRDCYALELEDILINNLNEVGVAALSDCLLMNDKNWKNLKIIHTLGFSGVSPKNIYTNFSNLEKIGEGAFMDLNEKDYDIEVKIPDKITEMPISALANVNITKIDTNNVKYLTNEIFDRVSYQYDPHTNWLACSNVLGGTERTSRLKYINCPNVEEIIFTSNDDDDRGQGSMSFPYHAEEIYLPMLKHFGEPGCLHVNITIRGRIFDAPQLTCRAESLHFDGFDFEYINAPLYEFKDSKLFTPKLTYLNIGYANEINFSNDTPLTNATIKDAHLLSIGECSLLSSINITGFNLEKRREHSDICTIELYKNAPLLKSIIYNGENKLNIKTNYESDPVYYLTSINENKVNLKNIKNNEECIIEVGTSINELNTYISKTAICNIDSSLNIKSLNINALQWQLDAILNITNTNTIDTLNINGLVCHASNCDFGTVMLGNANLYANNIQNVEISKLCNSFTHPEIHCNKIESGILQGAQYIEPRFYVEDLSNITKFYNCHVYINRNNLETFLNNKYESAEYTSFYLPGTDIEKSNYVVKIKKLIACTVYPNIKIQEKKEYASTGGRIKSSYWDEDLENGVIEHLYHLYVPQSKYDEIVNDLGQKYSTRYSDKNKQHFLEYIDSEPWIIPYPDKEW